MPMATTRRGPRRRSRTNAFLPSAPPVSAAVRSVSGMPSRPSDSVATAATTSSTNSTSAVNRDTRRNGNATVLPIVRNILGETVRNPA